MKIKETAGTIGFFALAGAATVGLAVAGVIQVAAAGVELLVVAPFGTGRKKTRAPQVTVPATRDQRIEVRLPRAA